MPIFLDQTGQGLVGFTVAAAWAATYIAIFLVMAVILALNVARHRKPKRIGVGDGGDSTLLLAMRVHANFTENVPLSLASLIMLPLLGSPVWAIHLVGGSMLLGRILHAVGLSSSQGHSFGRAAGIMLTWSSLLISAILMVWFAWR